MSALSLLSRALEACDPYTRHHSARVARLAGAVGEQLGLDGKRVAVLHVGGALHDVGKAGLSQLVLTKPGPLTDRELVEVQAHPRVGARLVARVEAFRPTLPAVLHHHERWDGTGYPDRLAGSGIPLDARILAVADSFDAMTSDRPYRVGLALDDALEEVDRCAGTQFDPEIVSAFLHLMQGRLAPLVVAA